MTFSGNTVDYEVDEHRAYITLNRPDRLNAITAEMAREISDAVADAPQAVVLDQVTAGVHVRMAALFTLLVGTGGDTGEATL